MVADFDVRGRSGEVDRHLRRRTTETAAGRRADSTHGHSARQSAPLPSWRAALPVLESPRVRLRELDARDAPSLLEMMSSHEVTQYLSPAPATLEEVAAFVAWAARAREAGRYLTFGVVPPGRDLAVGVMQIWPIEPGFTAAEWGFALAQSFWGSGLFGEAARLLIDFAIEVLGVQRLENRAAAENFRGNAALRKLGAVREGVLRQCFWCDGAYRDHVMWSILREDWQRMKMSLTRI